MSKSANIVAASLLNRHYATIRIGRLNFRVYQPRIKDLARAFSKERTDLSIDGRQQYSLEAVSKLLFRQRWKQRLFLWYANRYADYPQIREASETIAGIITGSDLLSAVKIDKTRKKAITETVGNNTIAGIMATMMEHLNISYRKAFEEINYPTMLLMMTDKVRSLVGDEQKIVKGSGKEMAARRGRKRR